MKSVEPKLAGKNLWHLFSTQELFKLETFLHGGLWCSELGSILGFEGDSEGSKFRGIFLSCWHINDGDPSEVAWKIFGADGDGFAIRTSPEKLLALVNAVSTEHLTARVGRVSYIPPSAVINDPAYQVREHHEQEEEGRFAFTLEDRGQSEDVLIARVRELVPCHCSGRDYQRPIHRLTFSESDGLDFALIVPIDPASLFEEFLIGPNVEPANGNAATVKLSNAGVTCTIRNLQGSTTNKDS